MKHYYTLVFLLVVQICLAQETKKVLFIGNSYTQALPPLIKQIANSVGDDLIHDQNTPGGYKLQQHAVNPTTINKIKTGGWDFVSIQEQSQMPSFPDAMVQAQVYPHAKALNDSIVKYNPCAETAFYMTWGRKNGDAANCPHFAPLCTYEGMDDLLRQRYDIMANDNQAIVSAVGPVWRSIRTNHPTIELYGSDGSHASPYGNYAAAVTFYTTFFRKDPTLITHNGSIPANTAAIIRNTVKEVVYNNLMTWNIGKYDPTSSFTYTASAYTYNFTSTSQNAISYAWDFGDGNTASTANPNHTYATDGNYTVKLTITNCGRTAVHTQTVNVNTASITDEFNASHFIIAKNPVDQTLVLNTTNKSEQLTLTISNMLGQEVLKQQLSKQITHEIDVTTLTSGAYIATIAQGNKALFNNQFIKR